MNSKWINKTFEELAEEADAGMRGRGPVVEAMGRLKQSIDKQTKSTTCFSYILASLTLVQAIAAAIYISGFLRR